MMIGDCVCVREHSWCRQTVYTHPLINAFPSLLGGHEYHYESPFLGTNCIQFVRATMQCTVYVVGMMGAFSAVCAQVLHSLGAHYPLVLVPLLNMLCLCSQFTCSINFHCCRAIRGPLYSVVKAGGVRWALMVYLSVSCYASSLAHTHRGEPPIHRVVSLAAVISCIIHKPSLVVYSGHIGFVHYS